MFSSLLKRTPLLCVLCASVLTPLIFSTRLSDYNVPKLALSQSLIFLAGGVWLFRMGVEGSVRVVRSALYLPMVLFVATSGVSLLYAVNPWQGLEVLGQQVGYFLLYFVIVHHLTRPEDVKTILWGVVGTGGAVALIGLLQYGGVSSFGSGMGDLPISTLGNVNYAAQYLVIAVPLSVVLAGMSDRRWMKGVVCLSAGLMVLHVLLIQSRGGWLGLSVAVGVLAVLGMRGMRVRHLPELMLLAVVVVGLSLPVLEGTLSSIPVNRRGDSLSDVVRKHRERTAERILTAFDFEKGSIRQRTLIWKDILRMAGDHPAFGVGIGGFEYRLPEYMSLERAEFVAGRNIMPYRAHNDYLEVWAETGPIGLLAFGWVLMLVLRSGYRGARTTDDGRRTTDKRIWRWVAGGTLAGMMGTAAHAFFSSNFQNPASGVHFWLAAGLAGAAELRIQKARYVSPAVPAVWRRVWACALGLAMGVFGVRANARMVLGDYYYARELECYYTRNLICGKAAFDRSVRYRPHHFAAYHVYGNMLYDAGAWDRAIEVYRKSLRYYPYNRNVHRLLGGALAQKGRYREAVGELEKAVAEDPVFAPARNDLGVYYRRLGDVDRAVEHLEKAVSLDPGNPEYLNNLGAAYATQGATEKGISCFERALEKDPEYADARVNLGLIYELQGSVERAIWEFERAIESDPGHRVAHLRLAALFRGLGRYEEAEQHARMAQGL